MAPCPAPGRTGEPAPGDLPPSRAAGSPPAHGTVANLPSHLRAKFLALEGSVPVAETAWSVPITLRAGTAAGVLVLPPTQPTAVEGGYGVVLGVWRGPRGLNGGQQWVWLL